MPIRISANQPQPPDSPHPIGPPSAAATRGGGGYRSITNLPDMYSTAAIVEAFKFWVPTEAFLLDNFFGNTRFFQSRFLGIETRKGRRVLAPVVSRYHPGVPVKRPAVRTTMYEVPKLAPYRTTFLPELDARSYGQQIENRQGDAAAAFAMTLADDTADLEDIIYRRVELFASQILFTGKVRYRLDGNGYEEFGYGPGVPLTYDPAIRWSDSAGAKPIDDLKECRRRIIADTGFAPDMLVMSDRVANMFIECDQVKEQLDKLHYVVGRIEPRPATTIAGTAQYLGRLLLPALDMWVYSETYLDEFDGETQSDMIPDHAALVGCTGQNTGYQFWGSILQVDTNGFEESYEAKLIPRLVFDVKNETSEYRLQARPALIPWDVASWRVINALPAPPLARARTPGEARAIEAKPAIPTEATEPKKGNPHAVTPTSRR